jgi:hypothetical protein
MTFAISIAVFWPGTYRFGAKSVRVVFAVTYNNAGRVRGAVLVWVGDPFAAAHQTCLLMNPERRFKHCLSMNWMLSIFHSFSN